MQLYTRLYCALYHACKYSNPQIHWCPKCLFAHYTYRYHHHADLSEGTEPTKCLSSTFCQRLNQFSLVSFVQHMCLRVYNLPISLVIIVTIYVIHLIIIITSEVWTTSHCLGLGHETMVCAVCLAMFFYTTSHCICVCAYLSITNEELLFAPDSDQYQITTCNSSCPSYHENMAGNLDMTGRWYTADWSPARSDYC